LLCTGFTAGVNPKLMSERPGHATVAFTLDTYTASVPELDHQVAEQIADLMNTSPDPEAPEADAGRSGGAS